jgi:non-heme chloroperoxidase
MTPHLPAGMLSGKFVKNAQMKVYKGGSHGMCTTEKDRVNADPLSFIKTPAQRS